MRKRLYLNTHNPGAATVAKQMGLGIELDDYLFFNDECKGMGVDEKDELYNGCVKLIQGFDKLFFHGIILGTDLKILAEASATDIMELCNQSFVIAQALGINHIVFHIINGKW